MSKKISKSFPLLMVSLLALSGCGENTDQETTEASALYKFVSNLKAGDLTKEEVQPLFENDMLSSNTKNIKYAEYSFSEYAPYWGFVEGLEESEYEEIVHDISEKYTFRSYDNDTVVTTEDVVRYDYDKSQIDPEDDMSEGISKTPVSYKGTAIAWGTKPNEETGEEGDITYVYTRDGKVDDGYSFVDKVEYDEDMMKALLQGGNGGVDLMYDVAASAKNVQDYYEAYSTQNWYENNTDFSANKDEEGTLTIVSSSSVFMAPYSTEAYWAYEEGVKTTNAYDGIYCKMGLIFAYLIEIKDGFVSNAQFIHSAYTAYLLKDANWKSGDPTPSKELTSEDLAKLNLIQTDTLGDGSKNTVQGGVLSAYPYTIESLKTDGENLGKYRKTLPNVEKYRESDATDIGCWFNIQKDLRD